MKNGYSRIRQAMRQNEQDVLNYLRKYDGKDLFIMSVAWHHAFNRLEAAGQIRYQRSRMPLESGKWIVKRYARPVTQIVR